MNAIKEIDYFQFVEDNLELNSKRKKAHFLRRAFKSKLPKKILWGLPSELQEEFHSYLRKRLHRQKPHKLDRFLFKEALTVTEVNPTGYILVDGQKIEANASQVIPSGTKVMTYDVCMGRLLILL